MRYHFSNFVSLTTTQTAIPTEKKVHHSPRHNPRDTKETTNQVPKIAGNRAMEKQVIDRFAICLT
jgi:hypothetical protein